MEISELLWLISREHLKKFAILAIKYISLSSFLITLQYILKKFDTNRVFKEINLIYYFKKLSNYLFKPK